MAGYLQFIAGDFGKTKYFYKGRDSFSSNNIFSKSLCLSDIASCEEQSTGESIKKAGGTVGGAVIGGVLTGGVGAIVGGMAGGNQVETTVVITTRDGKQGLARANGPMMDAIRGHLFERDRLPTQAGRTVGGSDILNALSKNEIARKFSMLLSFLLAGFFGIACVGGLSMEKKEWALIIGCGIIAILFASLVGKLHARRPKKATRLQG